MTDKDPCLAFVVAHHHAKGRVPVDLFNLIKHISTLSNNIVFVSTNINADEINRLSRYARVIARENFGYDFWSYKVGLDALGDLSGYQRIVFFNSSFITINPQSLCQQFLQTISGPVLRGLTFSNQRSPHVQSYWFAFEHADLINSDVFKRWWEGMVPLSSREDVIFHYELGMSDWFLSHGVHIDTLFKVAVKDQLNLIRHFFRYIRRKKSASKKSFKLNRLIGLLKVPFCFFHLNSYINPTHHSWKRVYSELKILKIELIQLNPTHQDLTSLYRDASQETLAMIKDATER